MKPWNILMAVGVSIIFLSPLAGEADASRRYDGPPEGPYCEEPPPDYPRCECPCQEDEHGSVPDSTSSSSSTSTSSPPTSSSSTSTSTTVATTTPPTMVHEDPAPSIQIDEPEVLGRAVDTLPAPLTELPKTGSGHGLLLAGMALTLGGVGVAVGKKRE